MQKVQIYGSDADYVELESACKSAGAECERRPMMYRSDDLSSKEILVIAFTSATLSIQAVSAAIMAIAKAYEAKQRKKVCYTKGHGLLYFQNYKPEELAKVLPETRAIYFGDAAPDDHPDYHKIDGTD